jgi:hypothetical protein
VKKKTTIFFLCISITLTSFSQGPWTKGKNNGYIQLGFSSIQYDKVQYNATETVTGNNNSDITLQLYTEFGLTSKLEAQLILPYKMLGSTNKITNVTKTLSGKGNATIGLKYLLYDKKWKISSGLLFSTSSNTKDDSNGLRTGFEASTFLPYFTFGSSSNKWYYYGNIGYGLMTNNYSDFIKIAGEVGYNIIPKGHLMFMFDTKNVVNKESFYTADKISYRNTSNYLDRQAYFAVGIKANYEFIKNRFGANIAGIGALQLNNTPIAPSINVGVYAKF